MTKVIHLYGGPGSGKSTNAAGIFTELKRRGYSAELVTEFAKDFVWEERKFGWNIQPYFLGKQWWRESRLYGKVDYVVTDSPFPLSAIFGKFYNIKGIDALTTYVNSLVELAQTRIEIHSFIVNRTKPFVEVGRNETAEQSREITQMSRQYLYDAGLSWDEIESDPVISMPQVLRVLGLKGN